ncbi:MAG TPA: PQQ-dependent sugar dehydrogenase [Solirubrobacterales bacterium]|nr:PQQ-dependent sugar dehydrogenase [Solirubrobacterales bacterium]
MRHVVVGAAAALMLAAPAANAAPVSSAYSEQVVAAGLSAPTAIAFLPDRRMLVTEKGGALKLVDGGSATTLTTIPVCTDSEMGLLGIAVDPSFESNGFVYLYRTKPGPSGCATATGRFNQVVRVTMSGNTVVAGSLAELLTGIRTTNGNHDGGTVRIGPDGKLWVSVGDSGLGDGGAPGQSTNPYAEDLSALEGKILRLERNGSPAAGNPYIGQPPARPEVYARGFRNPFRMSFDERTGRLWAGDVGQATIEEIDVVQSGGNYAWPRCEGTLPAGCQEPGDIPPVFEYPHSGATSLGSVVTGGDFLPDSFGAVGGQYVFGDYGDSMLYIAAPNAARTDIGTPAALVTNAGGPVDIVSGPDNALYWVALNTGEVRKLVAGYPRPQTAQSVRVSLVPAFQQCTAPDLVHGPPLGFGSCGLPVQRSAQLTIGTPDVNGASAESTGDASLRVMPGDPDTPADEADAMLRIRITDVRRLAGLADYTGQLQAAVGLRITDRDNPAAAGSPAGTVQDSTFTWTVPCTATADTTIGSTCSIVTTADAVTPGAVVEGMRAVWELGHVRVYDGGPDGAAGTVPNTLFASQGLFVP